MKNHLLIFSFFIAILLPVAKVGLGPQSRQAPPQLGEPPAGALPSTTKSPTARKKIDEVYQESKYQLSFLVATLPDPRSVYSGSFDFLLAAMRRAMEKEGYAFNSHWFPWSEKKETLRSSGPETREPGLLLFRQESPKTPGGEAETWVLKVVLIVPENPHSGVQKDTFRKALNLIAHYQEKDTAPSSGEQQVRVDIVGPTYSGSTASLRMAVEQVARKKTNWSFRIVSGTATSPANEKLFSNSRYEKRISFRTLMANDDVYAGEILTWLKDKYKIKPGNIVWLVETSLFGMTYREMGGTIIPFPMHIRHTRTAFARAKQTAAEKEGAPATVLELSLAESQADTFTPAPFDPVLSTRRAEMVLANILTTISKKRTEAMGIIATETKDKLFLAEVIHRYAPDMRLFTTDADLLLAHPDYKLYCHGMLVASTYPPIPYVDESNNDTQGDEKHVSRSLLQFPSDAARGIFEAVLTLIKAKHEPDLRGVWLSVVGNQSLWPLHFAPNRTLGPPHQGFGPIPQKTFPIRG